MEVGDGNNICTGPTGDSRWGWLVSRLARRPLATSAPLASEPPPLSTSCACCSLSTTHPGLSLVSAAATDVAAPAVHVRPDTRV
jgi:hypothetical protein